MSSHVMICGLSGAEARSFESSNGTAKARALIQTNWYAYAEDANQPCADF